MQIPYELLTSSATVVLAIIAIITFIYSGATALFYVVVLLALGMGFFNAWLISTSKSLGTIDTSAFAAWKPAPPAAPPARYGKGRARRRRRPS